jgi:hypothetical protein
VLPNCLFYEKIQQKCRQPVFIVGERKFLISASTINSMQTLEWVERDVSNFLAIRTSE